MKKLMIVLLSLLLVGCSQEMKNVDEIPEWDGETRYGIKITGASCFQDCMENEFKITRRGELDHEFCTRICEG